MTAPAPEPRGHRRRTWTETEVELQTACRAIGAIAGGARITGHPIDRTALRNAAEGLRRLLAEPQQGNSE